MTIEIINGQRVQTSESGKYLYVDIEHDRYFPTIAYLGNHADPLPECTEEEKIAWETAHPHTDPESPEVQPDK